MCVEYCRNVKALPLRGDACRWQAFIADRTEGETGGVRSNSDEVEMNNTNNSKLTGNAKNFKKEYDKRRTTSLV